MPSIKRTVKYVVGRVKQVFTPSSQKASYDLNAGTASAGTTTSAPTSSGTSIGSGISAGAGTTTTTTRTGGGGGGGGGGQSTTPTAREEALQMSLPSGERNLPPQSTTSSPSQSKGVSTTRSVTTPKQFSVRSRITDYSQMSRQPTAKEEVLQMSIPDTSFRTRGSVKEDYFYQNLLTQRREFESSPESSPYGMSTPEGETYFFIPDISKAQKYSQESFINLPPQEKGWLNARSLIGGEQIRQYQFQSQFPKLEQDTKIVGTEIGLRQVIRTSERFNINPLSKTEFGKAMSKTKEDFLYGFIPKTKGEVAITAVSFGVGGLIGGGLRTGGTFLRTFTPKAAPIIEKGISVGFGIATIPYVATQGSRVVFAKQDVGISLGEVSREFTALSLGGYVGARSEGIIKGYIRTRKLDKLNIDITAPEFLEGQQFPGIKKGQTAAQLRSEFYEPILPSEKGYVVKLKGYTGEGEFVSLKQTKELPFKMPEISPRGFSAKPIPFENKISSGKVRGGELEGGYFAPRVNPTFLRGGGYPKLFSFGEFGRLPVVERTTFSDIVYAPNVYPGRKNLRVRFTEVEKQDIQNALAGTGKPVLPFIKTEKEIVLVPESKVSSPTINYYYKDPITGERVPIFERNVIAEKEFLGFGKRERTKMVKDLKTELPELPSLTSSSRVGGSYLFSGRYNPYKSSSGSRSSQISSALSSSYPSSYKGLSSYPSRSSFGSSSIVSSSPYSSYGSGYSSIGSGYSSLVNPQIPFFLPPLGQEGMKFRRTPGRKFKRTASLGAALGTEFGIKFKQLSTGFEESGLFERPIKGRVSLPKVI